MMRASSLSSSCCARPGPGRRPTVLQRPIDLDTGQGVLHGSLLLPQQATPPVVLIIAGSGPTDRDGNNPASGASTTSSAWPCCWPTTHRQRALRQARRGRQPAGHA
jgi:hypothetical protein